MYLVYKAPPSDIIWGLVRDTRESIIDPGPWPDLDAAAEYYYLPRSRGDTAVRVLLPSRGTRHYPLAGRSMRRSAKSPVRHPRGVSVYAIPRTVPVKRNQNQDQLVITEPRPGSTDSADAQHEFAADVLRNLLRHIEAENNNGHDPYLVSHAWTEGPMMYLVYTAPPSDRTWGLARDTRESIINPESVAGFGRGGALLLPP